MLFVWKASLVGNLVIFLEPTRLIFFLLEMGNSLKTALVSLLEGLHEVSPLHLSFSNP